MSRLRVLLGFVLSVMASSTDAATFYTAVTGADTNSGESPAAAFRTIGRGVSAIEAGDTLEVGPGTYHEQVSIETSGTPEHPITIRARFPGRTFLKGSVTISDWRPVAGFPSVHSAPLEQTTYLVYQTDTGTELLEVANLNDLERTPGGFLYDAETKTLYVHPSDSASMDHHLIEASVLDYGFVSETATPSWNHKMRRVGIVIDGFVVSGYQKGGIMIRNADHCHVRHCVAYQTRAGIFFHGAWRSSITGCEAFRNNDRFMQEMGNIAIMGYSVHCLLENNVVYDTPQYGIRFYGGFYAGTMRANLAHDCKIGVHVKGTFGDEAYAERYLNHFPGKPQVEPGAMLFERNLAHNCLSWGLIPGACGSRWNTGVLGLPSRTSSTGDLVLPEAAVTAAKFADMAYHDMRLQSDSPHVGTGPEGTEPGAFPYRDEVYYVGPSGDDTHAGTSLAQAWKSLERACAALQPGQTLYVLPGEYAEAMEFVHLTGDARTLVRAYGKGTVTLDGKGTRAWGLRIADCGPITVDGFRFRGFTEGVRLERCRDVTVRECEVIDSAGAGIVVEETENTRLMHNTVLFNAGAAVRTVGGWQGLWIVSNILRDNDGPTLALRDIPVAETFYSDFNNLGGTVAEIGGKVLTLPEWRAATGLDAHSFDVNPRFVDAEARDLHLLPDSLCRGRGYLGRAAGPGRVREQAGAGVEFRDVRVQDVTPTTVDLSWTTRGRPTTMAVWYGTRADALDRLVVRNTTHFHRTRHVFTLDGLRPDTRYYFRVGERRLLEGGTPYHSFNHSWPALGPAGEARRYEGLRKEDVFDPEAFMFVTPNEAPVSDRTYHVSPAGDDRADGSAQTPWRSVSKACTEARAGDRVILDAGTYTESIAPMRSGQSGRPIVFEAAPGARVVLSGKRLLIAAGADLTSRRHIVLRGFYFQEQAQQFIDGGTGAQVCVVDGEDILIERCVFDGRMNYMFAGYVYRSRDVRFRNNIFLSHWSAIIATDNVGVLELNRNTFVGPTIHKLYGVRNEHVVIRNNLFGENLFPGKKRQFKVVAIRNQSLDMDYNCYYFAPANDERRVVDFGTPAIDLATVGPLPDGRLPERFGVQGDMEEWQTRYGQDRNSLMADPLWEDAAKIEQLRTRGRNWPDRFRDYAPFSRSELKLKPDSPCLGRGEGGVTIGADYED